MSSVAQPKAATRLNARARYVLLGTTSALALLYGQSVMAQGSGYSPWIGIGAEGGTRGVGAGAEIWVPFGGAANSVVYGFARGFGGTKNSDVDAGFGYRFLTGPNWMLGINASIGMGWSDDGNNAWRGAVGLEAKSLNWDFLLTGYFVDTDDQKRKGGEGRDGSMDGTIVMPTPNTIGMLVGVGGEKW
ncbi:MAG: hypothetical protein AB7O63_01755, partial [Reyranellaceae bacterium]